MQRALLVLRALNERGIWSLQDLQIRTGLPKSTLHRMLATLQAEHLVHSGEEMHGLYRLTRHVRQLSCGYALENLLADVAGPIAIAATKAHRWPLAIGVIDGDHIRANVCTMPYSPYSMKPTCFGHHYDLLTTAFGTTYLAFCSQGERKVLMGLLRQRRTGAALPGASAMRAMLGTIRQRGHGLRCGSSPNESSAIAIPLFSRESRLLGVLACSTFSRSLDQGWIDRNLKTLQGVARNVQALYPASPASSPEFL